MKSKKTFYKCGHKRGTVFIGHDTISNIAYLDWKKNTGEKQIECWGCYYKRKKKEIKEWEKKIKVIGKGKNITHENISNILFNSVKSFLLITVFLALSTFVLAIIAFAIGTTSLSYQSSCLMGNLTEDKNIQDMTCHYILDEKSIQAQEKTLDASIFNLSVMLATIQVLMFIYFSVIIYSTAYFTWKELKR